MKIDHVFVVGVGGTGSHLLESLSKLLAYHKNGTTSITVIDGDSFEEKNLERQLFNPEYVGVNKAEAASRRFPWLEFKTQPRFVNGHVFKQIVEEITEDPNSFLLIVLSVDNHATRKDLIMSMDMSPYRNFVIFSPGNDLSHGQVITYMVRDGEQITSHPFKKYPDLLHPKDHIPGFGCEVEAVSTPQLITANGAAALGVLLTVSAILDDKPWFEEWHFNCEKMKMVPQGTAVELKIEQTATSATAEVVRPLENEPIVIVAAEPVKKNKPSKKKKAGKKKVSK